MFKYAGINDPIYIDPIGKRLLNVKFIGDVDISKLIGGLEKGYGINIESKGNGIFKISVEDNLFALKSEVSDVDGKFADYTTTADLEENYAKKAKVEEIDGKFKDYALTKDIEANYATKSELIAVEDWFDNYTNTDVLKATYATKEELNTLDNRFDEYVTYDELTAIEDKFDDYTTTVDLENTYMKKNDVTPENFTIDEGYSNESPTNGLNVKYNLLKIKLPDDIKSKLIESTAIRPTKSERVNVLKFIIRKQFVFKYDGTLITEFIAYVEGGIVYCPVITNASNNTCNINHEPNTSNGFFIAFDQRLSFNPYELYMNGELSIMNLLSQDALISKLPTIRCDTIEAKNVLKLHESDVHYFYKPSIITEQTIDYTHRVINPSTSTYETVTDQIECYKMIYRLPDDYVIPSQLNFKFIEHCFGNEWSLYWDSSKGKWCGDNVQGRSNGKIESSKQYLRVDEKFNDYGMSGCYVRCKHDDWNGRFLDNTNENYMKVMFS